MYENDSFLVRWSASGLQMYVMKRCVAFGGRLSICRRSAEEEINDLCYIIVLLKDALRCHLPKYYNVHREMFLL